MSQTTKRTPKPEPEPVRVLGRGIRAARGVHLTLRSVRDAVGKTQTELARDSEIDQSDISRLETRTNFDDCQVATLRRYVEALGGKLELIARFGDKNIALAGAEPPPAQARQANKRLQRIGTGVQARPAAARHARANS